MAAAAVISMYCSIRVRVPGKGCGSIWVGWESWVRFGAVLLGVLLGLLRGQSCSRHQKSHNIIKLDSCRGSRARVEGVAAQALSLTVHGRVTEP